MLYNQASSEASGRRGCGHPDPPNLRAVIFQNHQLMSRCRATAREVDSMLLHNVPPGNLLRLAGVLALADIGLTTGCSPARNFLISHRSKAQAHVAQVFPTFEASGTIIETSYAASVDSSTDSSSVGSGRKPAGRPDLSRPVRTAKTVRKGRKTAGLVWGSEQARVPNRITR